MSKITERKFQPGEQIAYVPNHHREEYDAIIKNLGRDEFQIENLIDPTLFQDLDVEFGFVVKENPRRPGVYLCRYYYKPSVGKGLRTKLNSENTYDHNLAFHKHTSYYTIYLDWSTWVGDPLPVFLEDIHQEMKEAKQEMLDGYEEDYDLLEDEYE